MNDETAKPNGTSPPQHDITFDPIGRYIHETSNALTGAYGNLHSVLHDARLPADARLMLKTVETCLQTMIKLLAELNGMRKNKQEEQCIVDLVSMTESTIQVVRTGLTEGIVIQFEPHPSPLPVLIFQSLLIRAMVNLLLNAIQAIKPQAGTITVSCAMTNGEDIPHVIRSLYSVGESPYAYIRVQDTGCGMTEEQLLLAQLMNFSTKKGDHGYGLPVVRELVEKTGGALHIDSTIGVGTSFTLYVPLHQSADPRPLSDVRAIMESPEGSDKG